MTQEYEIRSTGGQSSTRSAEFDDLERVTLAEVRAMWAEYQSIRDRSAVYRFLHMVFSLADWWKRKPDEMREAMQTVKREHPNIKLPDDKYAAVIMLTADPAKIDAKMRSKWSRVLQYAARYKPERELLRDFLQRKGGINKCAARYARRLGRQKERSRKRQRTR